MVCAPCPDRSPTSRPPPPFGSPGITTYDLWVTDGTNTGTHKVAASGGVAGLSPSSYAALNGSVYFDGADTSGNFNLFKVDGSTGSVSKVAVGNASSTGLNPTGTVASNGKLYFQGKDAASNVTLWVSDGTAAGTSEVKVAGLTGSYYPSVLTPYGSKLAFAASSGVYLTDGTTAGTSQIPLGALSLFGNVNAMAKVGDKLVFTGMNNLFKNSLFVADGAGGGAIELQVPGLSLVRVGRDDRGHVAGGVRRDAIIRLWRRERRLPGGHRCLHRHHHPHLRRRPRRHLHRSGQLLAAAVHLVRHGRRGDGG